MSIVKSFRPTIVDVAKKANVTIATVSNVINTTGKVAPDTLSKVEAAIKDLNYTPNLHAQALRKRQSNNIGFMVPDITTNIYATFFSHFVNNAYQANYSVTAISFQHNPEMEGREMQRLVQANIDAIVLFNGFGDEQYLKALKHDEIPTVLLDRRHKGFSSVSYDNQYTASAIVNLLNMAGYQKIGYISESVNIQNLNDRYVGFLRGMQEAGLVIDANNTYIDSTPKIDNLKTGYLLMKGLLNRTPINKLAQVYFASSDLIALGALHALREAHIRVPEDIGIISYDNIQMAEFVHPRLTTVDQNAQQMANAAWETTERILADPKMEPRTIYINQKLIIRDSVIIPDNILVEAKKKLQINKLLMD